MHKNRRRADMSLVVKDNSATITGGVWELKNSATLRYDTSLRDVTLEDQGVRFVIDRRYED